MKAILLSSLFALLFLPAAAKADELKISVDDGKLKIEKAGLEFHRTSDLALNKYFLGQINHDYHPADPNLPSYVREKVGTTLNELAKTITQEATDAELEIVNNRVVRFRPDTPGRLLLTNETYGDVLNQWSIPTSTLIITPIIKERPAQLPLSSLNDLGIKELIGQGSSDFSGSSRSRIKNIDTGASKFRGLIIAQGEEFSFNKYLGTIDLENGYLPELVIKPTGLVPELGGGICQVATTAFRAAFFSGLPITQRKNHSIAVQYYKWINDDMKPSQGMDATIYPGAVDLKFVNNTSGAILIWTKIEGNRLYFDFYGTRDDRKVTADGPYVFDQTSSGAMKARVTRTVEKDGEKTEQEFLSIYRSPSLFPKIYLYPKPSEETSAPGNNEENPNNPPPPPSPTEPGTVGENNTSLNPIQQ